jgi:chromosome segregation ATPase
MAKNIINKLNTLLQSGVRGAVDDLTHPLRRDPSAPIKLGKNIDHEIAALRQQIDAALDDEERMAAEIGALRRQIAEADQQADRALSKGDEAAARHILQQMQRQQQRQAMLEAELAEHRFSTSELISRVNALEAVVAQAQQQQAAPPPDDTDDDSLSIRLSRIREEAAAQPTSAPQETPVVVDERAIEDDLARRRARLSG